MFCGFVSYYRIFVRDLTRKNVPFDWDDKCEASFLELKKQLTSTPILVAPRDEVQYVLDTDASDMALGAVLQQEQHTQLHVIGYVSQALSHSERRHCITCKKLLGVIYGLKKYPRHLLATHHRPNGSCCCHISHEDTGAHLPTRPVAGSLAGVRHHDPPPPWMGPWQQRCTAMAAVRMQH